MSAIDLMAWDIMRADPANRDARRPGSHAYALAAYLIEQGWSR